MTKTFHQIECKNLALSYDGRTVLRDVSFFADRGDYLCIVGENGSGKSTLVRALLGLKRPAGGEILFGDGFEQNEIGYLPQQTDIQRDFPASVREVVLSGLLGKSRRPFYSSSDRKKAAENM
ncbi:MAG: ATP-binding cassette domain-containing protein, partial [Eubacteriales bacterium]